MTDEDLSKLKIDKSAKTAGAIRRMKPVYVAVAILVIIIGVFLRLKGFFTPGITVEVMSISQVYPSQALALLDASGYVVAQRKAAVASKVTGRLVSLMVEEGSRVTEGQVIASLESEDFVAARDQAAENLKAARANLEGVRAELNDASLDFYRKKELLARGVISRAEFDVSEAKYRKALATVAAAEAAVEASSAAGQFSGTARGRRSAGIYSHQSPLRCGCVDEECRCRGYRNTRGGSRQCEGLCRHHSRYELPSGGGRCL